MAVQSLPPLKATHTSPKVYLWYVSLKVASVCRILEQSEGGRRDATPGERRESSHFIFLLRE